MVGFGNKWINPLVGLVATGYLINRNFRYLMPVKTPNEIERKINEKIKNYFAFTRYFRDLPLKITTLKRFVTKSPKRDLLLVLRQRSLFENHCERYPLSD